MVENYTIKQKVIFLLTNFNFMVLLIALTGIYYLTTGIQFWITDYFIIVLGTTKNEAFTTFAVCSLTGPILGVVLGGFFFTRIGGYNSPKAFPICVFVMSIGCTVGLPLVYVNDFYFAAVLLWL